MKVVMLMPRKGNGEDKWYSVLALPKGMLYHKVLQQLQWLTEGRPGTLGLNSFANWRLLLLLLQQLLFLGRAVC